MLIGYNTNGYAHHAPLQALQVLATQGYQSVALTIDHNLLAQSQANLDQVAAMRETLQEYDLRCVIETGARFLLDPWVKHEPTLVSSSATARLRRVDFYRYALDVARSLGADCVSLWSGIVRDSAAHEAVLDRLAEGLEVVCAHAQQLSVPIGFEPEPGMAIDTMERFSQLLQRFDSPALKLTLDIGHLHCQGELPLEAHIQRWGDRLINIHLEDMRAGVHDHLMFGEGEIDFPPVLQAIYETGYRSGVHVELSRHSHDAVNASQRAFEFLSPRWPSANQNAPN